MLRGPRARLRQARASATAPGSDAEKGINVGDEWTYRSYIEGGTPGRGRLDLRGHHRRATFPDGLPVEMTIGVFRTYKGDIEKGVLGSLSRAESRTDRRAKSVGGRGSSRSRKEFTPPTSQFDPAASLPRGRRRGDEAVRPVQGPRRPTAQVEIWLQCVEPAQYFGAAQADLYLRARDASFALNFAKGYLGIWLQMLLVIGFGVMFSTFLSGPVAMLATLGRAAGRLLQRLHVPAWPRGKTLRRRAVRVVHPPGHASRT